MNMNVSQYESVIRLQNDLLPGKRVIKTRRCTYQVDEKDHTAFIISCRPGRCKRFKLPEKIVVDGISYKVTDIDYHVQMRWSHSLRHLVIPDSISFVDEDSLCALPNLRSVHIGKGVDGLNNWNFRSCPKLRVFTIDKSNPYLRLQDGLLLAEEGTLLLRSLFPIRHLRIPEGAKEVYAVAFWYDNKLESITFPSSLRKIGDNSFSNLPKLRKIVLPEGFENLVVQCFMDCENLEWVDLPSTLRSFGRHNFLGCYRLNTLILRSNTVMECGGAWDVEDIPSSCRIFVPSVLVDAYRRHPVWGKFPNIEAIGSKSYISCSNTDFIDFDINDIPIE